MFTHKAREAGSFDDPMLMLGIDSGLVREPVRSRNRDMETARVIGISQMRLFFGKRDLAARSGEP